MWPASRNCGWQAIASRPRSRPGSLLGGQLWAAVARWSKSRQLSTKPAPRLASHGRVAGRCLAGWMAGWSRGLAAPWPAGWPCARLAGWLGGREIGSKNWIKKLDHRCRAIQFPEMDDPISDPIFRSMCLVHSAAEVCSEKLDHKIGSSHLVPDLTN